jgi:hypothetical protein
MKSSIWENSHLGMQVGPLATDEKPDLMEKTPEGY